MQAQSLTLGPEGDLEQYEVVLAVVVNPEEQDESDSVFFGVPLDEEGTPPEREVDVFVNRSTWVEMGKPATLVARFRPGNKTEGE